MSGVDLIARFLQVAALLVAAGFYGVSPWWLETLTNFWTSGRRTLVLRVGRRGGKSSTLCLIAVVEALFGGHRVSLGDVGVVAIVSLSRDQANERLRTIEAILLALRVKHKRAGDTIELTGRPVIFKTFTASLQGVVGFTAICILCDEVARWRDADTGANPAREVIASLRPTMATVKTSRMYVSSSAFSTVDYHYELFEMGNTAQQIVAQAPTWVANPTVSEAETHELEPDPRVHAREYAAVPQSSVSGAFDTQAIGRIFRVVPDNIRRGERLLIIDASSGRKDSWTWAIVGWSWPAERATQYLTKRTYVSGSAAGFGEPRYLYEALRDARGNLQPNPKYAPDQHDPFLHVEEVGGIEGSFWRNLSAAQAVERTVAVGRRWGVRQCIGDQREAFALASEFARHSMAFASIPWTNDSKLGAVERLRDWMRRGTLIAPEHAALRKELESFQERVTPSGSLTFGARGSGHDDYVALLLTSAMAEVQGLLPCSPYARPRVTRALPHGLIA